MTGALRTFARRAEVMKIARLLDVQPSELSFLDALDPGELQHLREQITAVLFDSGGPLGRLAAASRLLPSGVIAKIAQHSFGPVLTGRIAGLLEPDRAADVARHLPTPFLAEVAIHLDPRRAAAMLARIPPQRIAEVASHLAAAAEHVTLGRFVGHLGDDAVKLSLRAMDDLTVLRVAVVLEELTMIERVLALLTPGRRERLPRAAEDSELWPDVLELLDITGAPAPASGP